MDICTKFQGNPPSNSCWDFLPKNHYRALYSKWGVIWDTAYMLSKKTVRWLLWEHFLVTARCFAMTARCRPRFQQHNVNVKNNSSKDCSCALLGKTQELHFQLTPVEQRQHVFMFLCNFPTHKQLSGVAPCHACYDSWFVSRWWGNRMVQLHVILRPSCCQLQLRLWYVLLNTWHISAVLKQGILLVLIQRWWEHLSLLKHL